MIACNAVSITFSETQREVFLNFSMYSFPSLELIFLFAIFHKITPNDVINEISLVYIFLFVLLGLASIL